MSPGNPTNVIILALIGIAAVLFLIASVTGTSKWRRRYEEEREEYASHAESADAELRAARQRIAELEHAHGDLQEQHSDALASLAQLKAEAAARNAAAVAPLVAVPAATQPIEAETVEPEPVKAEPVEAEAIAVEPVATPEPEPAAPEPEPAAPAPIAEHRPIAPETAAEPSEARPIGGLGATITELPPAPIFGVTPLRAVEPPEPEVAVHTPAPAEPVAEMAPPAHEPTTSEPVHAEPEAHEEAPHSDAPEHPAHAKPLATLSYLAEGAAIAEAAHLAWNAYASHKHHAEAEHAAEAEHVAAPAEAPVPEPVDHAAHEQAAEEPHAAAPVVEEAPAANAPAKAWFGSARRDDLTRMRGVDEAINTRLVGLGVTSFDDIVNLSHEDEMALEQRLDLPAGYMTREQWRDQASLLRDGNEDAFNQRFGQISA